MKNIKERCMWFIGANRKQETNYTSFMFSESDIVLFDWDKHYNIARTNKDMIVGMSYTVAKQGYRDDKTK